MAKDISLNQPFRTFISGSQLYLLSNETETWPAEEKVCWKAVEQTDGRAQLCGFVQLCQSLSLPTQLSKDSPAADFLGMWKCTYFSQAQI